MKIKIKFVSNTERTIESVNYFYVDKKFNTVKVIHNNYEFTDEWDFDEVKEIQVVKEGE